MHAVPAPRGAPLRRAAVRTAAKTPGPGSKDEGLKDPGESGILAGALQWPPKPITESGQPDPEDDPTKPEGCVHGPYYSARSCVYHA